MNSFNGTHAAWMRRVVGAAVPVLLVAGGVSAAFVSGGGGTGGGGDTRVAALQAPLEAGAVASDASPVAPMPEPTAPATPPAPVPTTVAPVRSAASTPTTAAAPVSTRPTTPTTSAAPATTTTTATTIPAGAVLVTFVNEYPDAVRVEVNGVQYNLAAGQRLPDQVVFPGNAANQYHDGISVSTAGGCGNGDGMPYFQGAQRFTFTVIVGPPGCGGGRPTPDWRITRH